MSDTKDMPNVPLNRQLLRTLLIVVVVLGAAIVTYLMLNARNSAPDYYVPARTALVTAKERLEVSYGEEANLLTLLQQTHRDLETAVEALDQASIDPELRNEVDTLRLRLRALEDVKRLEKTTPEQLKNSYHAIEAQLDALIAKLETHDNAN